MCDSDSDRPSPHLSALGNESREEIHKFSCRLAVLERHEYHLISVTTEARTSNPEQAKDAMITPQVALFFIIDLLL